jgi:predicted thioesterase
MKVWCESELVEIDRRRLVFKVAAYDESGLIGEGTHERFIIDKDRFESKAASKL